MVRRKDKRIGTEERRELGPCNSAYISPELIEAKREVEKKKSAINDFFLQAMTHGIKIRLEGEKVPKWHSAKEAPPEQGCYLVWTGKYCDIALYFKRNDWRTRNSFGVIQNVEVTHWMPLPEPPKGEEDDAEV